MAGPFAIKPHVIFLFFITYNVIHTIVTCIDQLIIICTEIINYMNSIYFLKQFIKSVLFHDVLTYLFFPHKNFCNRNARV